MRQFIDDNFLLKSETAVSLYHSVAKKFPIVDYHCHLNPQEIAEDRRFNTVTELMLGGDHYKWRVMRADGVEEKYITGDAPDYEKFEAFAKTLAKCAGNPLYHWTHLELKRYFDFDSPLNGDSCAKAYEVCNRKLQLAEFSAKGLIKRSNVKILCTTDDPVDDLSSHKKIKEDKEFFVSVLPAFRPDKAINIDKPGFAEYINKLSEVCGFAIHDYTDYLKALFYRVDYFDRAGCKTADHGFDYFAYEVPDQHAVETAFKKALAGKNIEKREAEQFKTAVLRHLCAEYKQHDWVLQLHFGCARNNNSAMFEKLGPDTGFDSIAPFTGAGAISPFFNELYKDNSMPKTIFYSLDENDYRLISTSIGCFQGESAGRLQLGPAWWFNDTKPGMVRQLTDLASSGVLGNYIGMLTDSRSLISYPRHEYFRRILCNLIGTWVEDGELPLNEDAVSLVSDICYNNAIRYFGFA
jgi:glucuronate isomerase